MKETLNEYVNMITLLGKRDIEFSFLLNCD